MSDQLDLFIGAQERQERQEAEAILNLVLECYNPKQCGPACAPGYIEWVDDRGWVWWSHAKRRRDGTWSWWTRLLSAGPDYSAPQYRLTPGFAAAGEDLREVALRVRDFVAAGLRRVLSEQDGGEG